jgi:hypothetical protein
VVFFKKESLKSRKVKKSQQKTKNIFQKIFGEITQKGSNNILEKRQKLLKKSQ